MASWRRGKFALVVGTIQIIFLVLCAVFVRYESTLDTRYDTTGLVNPTEDAKIADEEGTEHELLYGIFQDVHVMMFIGFGYLMTFLKRYGFSSVGLNMLVAAFTIQWAMLMSGFLHLHNGKIYVNIITMFTSDFAAAAVLISFGAVLGKLSPLQYVLMALMEIVFFAVNEWIGVSKYMAVDMGGSMFVHIFGAYFGIACSRALYKIDVEEADPKECSVYQSDIFSMIGTIFLWMFWPSFNSALASGDDQHRAIFNTYICLASCAVTSFLISSVLSHEDKFDMVHIQNSTLAGGVAIGTTADMMLNPWGAMLIGILAAILSVIGYKYISPFLYNKFHLHDTCGVNNLHGMPGIMAGIIGIIVVGVADLEAYGYSLYNIFPARVPVEGTDAYDDLLLHIDVEPGSDRSAGGQAGYQAAALFTTLAMAIGGGIFTGLVLRVDIFNRPMGLDGIYDDTDYWEIPDDGFPELNPMHVEHQVEHQKELEKELEVKMHDYHEYAKTMSLYVGPANGKTLKIGGSHLKPDSGHVNAGFMMSDMGNKPDNAVVNLFNT